MWLITDTVTGDRELVDDLDAAIAVRVVEARQAGSDLPDVLDAEAHELLLGMTYTDTPDLDDLDDEAWALWIAAHLADGYWSDGSVLVKPGHDFGAITPHSWPGGSIQVAPVHGDRERSWRHTESWADLREWVEVARDEEESALAEVAAERAAAEAQWQPLRDAQQVVVNAEDALRVARAARDRTLRAHAAEGVTAYRLAQVTGLSQPAVRKILR